MEVVSVDRMVLVEPDEDLTACVTRFFSDRFEVCHVSTLEEAQAALRDREARILFANIDSPGRRHASIIEQIHSDQPQMRIIVSYLSPTSGESWEKSFNECVDVFVRKPYRVFEVDKVLRALGKKERA